MRLCMHLSCLGKVYCFATKYIVAFLFAALSREGSQNIMANKSLGAAKVAKDNEFYTRYEDIQAELNYYVEQFRGKIVYCNCDDPAESHFSDFFKINFNYLGLKKLICTRYAKSDLFRLPLFTSGDPNIENGYKLEITGDVNGDGKITNIDFRKTVLDGDGDFRSDECVELLKEADIVCTNPPFSLYREYIAQLVEYNKNFLVIGGMNSVTYKEIFPLVKDNKIWGGYTHPKKFMRPDGNIEQLGNAQWFTNLDVKKRYEKLILTKVYDPAKYPKYDNYDAINVDAVQEIPKDYFGVIGVPKTFPDSYNPDQFEIIGCAQTPMGVSLRTKVYPQQVQVDKNGRSSKVSKLNDGAAIEVDSPPKNKTYYIVGGKYFIKAFARILIKRREKK